MNRRLVAVGSVFVLAGGGGVAFAQRLQEPGWVWYEGATSGYVGELAGSHTLVVNASGSINLRASHVRLMSDDGQFVFEHSNSSSTASLNAYFLGTSERTPIQIGNSTSTLVTPLVVAGEAGQESDLQQWTLSGKTVAAIDGKGRLRLGEVTLDPELVDGRVELYAEAGSSKQLLAQGAKAP